MSTPLCLPEGLRVLERGWLSANNIVLFDGGQAVLIDSGYVSHAEQTVALLQTVLGNRVLTRIINTHSHADHVGGNAAVQKAFGCTISVPCGMAAAVECWDEAALILSVADQRSARFHYDDLIEADGIIEAGGMLWRALPAPGHDMDALVYYNPDKRILISGDALWRDGFGILFPEVLGQADGLGAARRTLEALARLSVDCVIPGHGAPFTEFDEAMSAAFSRLAAFEVEGDRMARNAIRACVTFTLLDRRRLLLDDLPRYLMDVPLYCEANTRFLGLTAQALADWLVKWLEQAGVARREAGYLVACG